MSRRPFAGPLIAACVSAFALAGCREQPPGVSADWRPAAAPQRIVAASLFATEVLLAIAPRERIAAVHVLATDPAYSLVVGDVQGLPVVGAEPEQLLAADPDLVICDPFTRPETLALLASASVPVVIPSHAASFADIAANVRRVGRACWLDDGAGALVASLERRLAALAVRAPDVAGWRVMNLEGGWHSHGRGSLFDAVVRAAGARNVAAERGAGPFRRIDVETLLGWSPDALVMGGRPATAGEAPAWLLQAPGAALLPCIEQRRIVRAPGPLLATTSPRLVEAAELLQATLLQWGRP